MSPDLNDLADECLSNSKRWFPHPHLRGQEHAILHMTLGIAGEAGEIVEVVKKAHRFGDIPNPALLAPEIVDVMIYCLNLSALMGFDLDTEFALKMRECEARYQRRISGAEEKPVNPLIHGPQDHLDANGQLDDVRGALSTLIGLANGEAP